MKEFDIISTYFERPVKHSSIIKSIGDDCALLSVEEGFHLAISMDTLVSGRHFPEDALPEKIATRAFCTCVSDLAAMGAIPRWFTLGLTLPESNTAWLASFSEALFDIADKYQCELVGGDTTQGPLTITVQVHGLVKRNQQLTRDTAVVGDTVFVTGTVGDGAAALDLLVSPPGTGQSKTEIKANSDVREYLNQRFYRPEPQISAGQMIAEYTHAAIDISDGLLADLQHISKASYVDIELEAADIPISPACRQLSGDRALEYALTGGDDYQIAFAVPEKSVKSINHLIIEKKLDATQIGKVIACQQKQPTVRCFDRGQLLTVDNKKGYQHFAS